jgi:uncharacterized ion transporter superfamily protein YfcC
LTKVPHTLVLLFAMMVLAWGLTWVVPQGAFDRTTNDAGRDVVVAGSYQASDTATPLGPTALLTVVPRAMADAQGIIFFVLIIGGALAVIRHTGAIDAGLHRVVERFGNKPRRLIGLGMLSFGVASATLGMAEEYIPLAAILIAMCVAMRMDAVTAIGIMVVGYGIGYGVAIINPFTLLIAQDVAQLAPGSGMGFRLALWLPFFAIGFHHIWRYAQKVQADPSQSLVADVRDAQPRKPQTPPPLNRARQAVLGAMVLALAVLVYGIVAHQWYLTELGAVFIALAMVGGLIGRLRPDAIAQQFSKGAAELAGTALLIGFARSIALLLEDGQVLDTIVWALASPLSVWPTEAAAVGMMFIQSALNFFIPSGSGQAFVTMPLMAPIGDLVGISRQVSVLAFQFGDGFMNMVVPTNPVLMGIIGLAGIPYDRWFRFIAPLIIKLLFAGALALVVAVWLGYA